ncbi:GH39 family glycosyl hydrolase [Actinopolymorpha alba]|uniref:GH39 family glycosyl hydrolase n=1 Tax=Actinopolymorpha alba TaxID=533267 RepID=UPI00037B5815|nr:hypothetical protein [Actinopolymorpha alba]
MRNDDRRLHRRRFLELGGGAVAGLSVAGAGALRPSSAAADATRSRSLEIDANQRTGEFNRKLFSVVGVTQDTGLKVDSWKLLNPAGTQSRLEVAMAEVAPQRGAFDVKEMFIYLDNTNDRFFNQVVGAGLEPVLLCCYSTSWLGNPPTDPQGWADIVAQVVEHFNGVPGPDYQLRVKYLEIWNEPNHPMFWKGTPEQFHALFKIAAHTIHDRFPGVLVGGPAFSPGFDGYYEYGKAFVDAAGDDMDYFIYHSYGDDPPKIAADITFWRDYIRTHTRHADPRLMVTEAESFKDSDAVKVQNLIGRQFTLLDHADSLIGWHQFKLYEYKEGWYTFGLVYNDGSVFGRNYWPYWLFRDADGQTVRGSGAEDDPGGHQVATVSRAGARVNTVYWRDPEVATGRQLTRFSIRLPREPRIDRILTVSRVRGTTGEVIAARKVSRGVPLCEYSVQVEPGEAVSLTLDDAAAATTPWVGLAATASSVAVGTPFTAAVNVLNTTPHPISGEVHLAGLPAGWTTELQSGTPTFGGLDTGDQARTTWRITPTAPTKGAVAYRAIAMLGAGATHHSIPIRITAA